MDPLTIGMALANLAPGLLKIFTGSDKAEEVAEKVVDIAKTVTGVDTGEQALEEIRANPDKLLDFRQAIAAQQVELERMYLEDVADARKMQTAALAQDDVFSKRFVYYFAMVWSAFAMCYFAAVTFVDISPDSQRSADTILGVLIGTVLVGIFHYLYGSTRGSQAKTAMIAARNE